MLWKVLLQSFDALIRSIKVIFHQLTGLFFLFLGLSAAYATWREYLRLTPEAPSSAVRLYTTAGFAVLLLGFALTSFLRAWSVRRKD